MSEELIVSVEDGVMTMTMNRPEAKNAMNKSMAEAIAAADPMHAAGARSYRVRPWIVNEGTISVKVGFASGEREVL